MVWSGVGTLAVALVANAYDLEYTIIDQWSGVGTLAVALAANAYDLEYTIIDIPCLVDLGITFP